MVRQNRELQMKGIVDIFVEFHLSRKYFVLYL